MQINASASLQGIYQAQRQITQQADTIASKATLEGEQNNIEPVFKLKNSQQQFEASAKALQVENEVLGTLFDSQA